jgi:phage terminase small subunit
MEDQDTAEPNPAQTNGNGTKRTRKRAIPTRKEMAIQKAAQEYVANGGNATKAYIAAGYSPKGAGENQRRLTKDDRFAAAVKREMARAAKAADVQSDAVMGQLARLAFYDPGDFISKTTGKLDYKKMRRAGLTFLIEKIKVIESTSEKGERTTTEYELPRKLPALEALMRAIGMEKELAKNPQAEAAKALERLKMEYPDLPLGRHEQIIADTYGVPIKDLGAIG